MTLRLQQLVCALAFVCGALVFGSCQLKGLEGTLCNPDGSCGSGYRVPSHRAAVRRAGLRARRWPTESLRPRVRLGAGLRGRHLHHVRCDRDELRGWAGPRL